MHGEIIEQPDMPYVRRRDGLLRGAHRFPEAGPAPAAAAAGFVADALPGVRADLAEHGYALRQLDRPLDNAEFRALGARLGEPIPELDPAVQSFVEDDVILNLITRHAETGDVSLQPFAANYLSLHSEGSGRPVDRQPRYLVLMCCEPGSDEGAAQTVLTSMAGTARRMPAGQLEVLARTSYEHAKGDPWIVREQDNRTVFSFRDFMAQPLHWTYDGPPAPARAVDAALRSLLEAMYDPADMVSVRWRPGRLLIFDNTYFFHGRTARLAPPERRRHLKRLRIAAVPTPGEHRD